MNMLGVPKYTVNSGDGGGRVMFFGLPGFGVVGELPWPAGLYHGWGGGRPGRSDSVWAVRPNGGGRPVATTGGDEEMYLGSTGKESRREAGGRHNGEVTAGRGR
jgi:hypothetical protein